jgi:hypothetical protein
MKNTAEYRKAYLANLQQEIKNNNKHAAANKGPINPATMQYIQNTGHVPLGVSTFALTNPPAPTSQTKGKKVHFKK